MPKKMTIVEKWKEHRKKLKGAELPYIPYLSEELCIPDEITEEIQRYKKRMKLIKFEDRYKKLKKSLDDD